MSGQNLGHLVKSLKKLCVCLRGRIFSLIGENVGFPFPTMKVLVSSIFSFCHNDFQSSFLKPSVGQKCVVKDLRLMVFAFLSFMYLFIATCLVLNPLPDDKILD